MAAIESHAFFDERARMVGLSEEEVVTLRAQGWTTMGRLAFATSSAPGTGDDSALRTQVVNPAFGDNPRPHIISMARRLHFEAYTFVAATGPGTG